MTSRHGWLALQAIVTVALLTLLLRGLDLGSFRELFARLPLWFYLGSLGVILGGQVLYAWRWSVLLNAAGVRVPFGVIVRQYFIGIFVNNFLPSTVGGDVAKVYLLGRDVGYRVVTASVLLDRLLGIALLATFAAATLWALPMPSPAVAAARLAVSGIALAGLIALFVATAGTGGLPERLAFLGPRAVALAQRLQRLRADMAVALRNPAVLVAAVLVVAGYFLAVTEVYLLFLGLQAGRTPPMAMTFGVVTATSVLSNVPVSLNGLGLREQLHATLLAPLGVPREAAVAISLLLFGHSLIASIVGFVFWMRTPALPSNLAAHRIDDSGQAQGPAPTP